MVRPENILERRLFDFRHDMAAYSVAYMKALKNGEPQWKLCYLSMEFYKAWKEWRKGLFGWAGLKFGNWRYMHREKGNERQIEILKAFKWVRQLSGYIHARYDHDAVNIKTKRCGNTHGCGKVNNWRS